METEQELNNEREHLAERTRIDADNSMSSEEDY